MLLIQINEVNLERRERVKKYDKYGANLFLAYEFLFLFKLLDSYTAYMTYFSCVVSVTSHIRCQDQQVVVSDFLHLHTPTAMTITFATNTQFLSLVQ